jgi:hypothetical protein
MAEDSNRHQSLERVGQVLPVTSAVYPTYGPIPLEYQGRAPLETLTIGGDGKWRSYTVFRSQTHAGVDLVVIDYNGIHHNYKLRLWNKGLSPDKALCKLMRSIGDFKW